MEKVVVAQGEREILNVLQTLKWTPVAYHGLSEFAHLISSKYPRHKAGIRFRDDTLEWLGYDNPSFYAGCYEILSYAEFVDNFCLERFAIPLKEVLDDV